MTELKSHQDSKVPVATYVLQNVWIQLFPSNFYL